MKVFLDVGAHLGETLAVAIQPRWGFDRIYCFEPAPPCWSHLKQVRDSRIEICRFGLFDHDGSFELYNSGSLGASLSAEKDGSSSWTQCQFRDAAKWFEENLNDGDRVFVKINVEGAEYEIVRRLFEAGALQRVSHLLIHFDVRKVPSRAHLEPEMRAMLDAARVDWVLAERMIFGSVSRGTRNWLEWSQLSATKRPVIESLRRAEGRVRVRLAPLRRPTP